MSHIARNDPSDRDRSLAPGRAPPLGAHLVTPRRGYTHHGIYVGQGRVVQYAGLARGLRTGPVEEVSLAQFTDGHSLRVRGEASPCFDGAEVVRRARCRIGENRYRLLSNNCEHFCEWCLRAEPRSNQVDKWLARPSWALWIMLSLVSTSLLTNGRARATQKHHASSDSAALDLQAETTATRRRADNPNIRGRECHA